MHRQSILLVDDDTEFLEILQRRFERRGFCVRPCDSLCSALEIVERASVDVAVLDRTLNGENGLDLVRGLKKLDPALPIVMLSGHSSCDDMHSAMEVGVQRYLCKPCSLAEIEAAVKEVLASRASLAT